MRSECGKMGGKVGDNFTIPLDSQIHQMLHQDGDEENFLLKQGLLHGKDLRYERVLAYAESLYNEWLSGVSDNYIDSLIKL